MTKFETRVIVGLSCVYTVVILLGIATAEHYL